MHSPKAGETGLAMSKPGTQGGDLSFRVDYIFQSQKCFKQRSQMIGPQPRPSDSVLVWKTTITFGNFQWKACLGAYKITKRPED